MPEPLRFPPPPLGGPARRGPLGAMAERLAEVPRALCLDEVPFPGQVCLQGDGDAPSFQDAVEQILGIRAPTRAGGVARGEDVEILCLAPDRWLVVTPGGREEVLQRRLRQELEGQLAAVVDMTDARAVFHLAGPLAREVLAKGGLLPEGAGEGAPGWCHTGRMGGLEAIVQQIDDRPAPEGRGSQPCFRIYVAASRARAFVRWVLDAVAEY